MYAQVDIPLAYESRFFPALNFAAISNPSLKKCKKKSILYSLFFLLIFAKRNRVSSVQIHLLDASFIIVTRCIPTFAYTTGIYNYLNRAISRRASSEVGAEKDKNRF